MFYAGWQTKDGIVVSQTPVTVEDADEFTARGERLVSFVNAAEYAYIGTMAYESHVVYFLALLLVFLGDLRTFVMNSLLSVADGLLTAFVDGGSQVIQSLFPPAIVFDGWIDGHQTFVEV